ncbi:hypothetical protein J2S13_000359 [Oikeobacillus pervagus]|uniref:Uncharacterized protein n=1 Tax=Oikeobacillus pervagus TaxID=1325931 RepID=A0AAJ1SWK9_9BACI|nr:hypothetical protein [Oikeobacillus pervagus]
MIRSKDVLVKSIHYTFIIGMTLLFLCGIISFIIVFTLGKEQLTPENIRFIVSMIAGVFFYLRSC